MFRLGEAAGSQREVKTGYLARPDAPPNGTASRCRNLTLPAGFIAPCLPMMAPSPPSGPQWLHEVKLNGVRIIARKDSTRITLYGCFGDDLTKHFPMIVAAMSRLPACTIDGEAVMCDDNCDLFSDQLMRRPEEGGTVFYAFDLIELAGDDRRRDPLSRRKSDLSRLLAGGGPAFLLNGYAGGEEFSGTTIFEYACSVGLEGIISKRKDSRYLSGLSPYWLETINSAGAVANRVAEGEAPAAIPEVIGLRVRMGKQDIGIFERQTETPA
jgi:bifunctional non-homologous end joining protein LigD